MAKTLGVEAWSATALDCDRSPTIDAAAAPATVAGGTGGAGVGYLLGLVVGAIGGGPPADKLQPDD